jgi:NAD(P)-dependent dehydrogenase (short-subunit alcohol dehydrogenase family)
MGILDGKVAIVTGAGKGIGRAESLALAKEGAAVVLVGRNKEDVVNVAGEIEALGGRALPIECDVSQRDQVDRAVAAAFNAFGPIDILVNNAQAIPQPKPLQEWSGRHERDVGFRAHGHLAFHGGLFASHEESRWQDHQYLFRRWTRLSGRICRLCSRHGSNPLAHAHCGA